MKEISSIIFKQNQFLTTLLKPISGAALTEQGCDNDPARYPSAAGAFYGK
jgi:hypothetical protein